MLRQTADSTLKVISIYPKAKIKCFQINVKNSCFILFHTIWEDYLLMQQKMRVNAEKVTRGIKALSRQAMRLIIK